MRIMTTVIWLLVGVLMAVSQVGAQTPVTRLAATDAIDVKWPSPTIAADTLDAPDGFRIKATPVGGTAATKTWTAGLTARSLVVSDYPATGAFTLTVHPYNSEGEGGPGTVLGPFGRTRIPQALAGATASVVPRP